MYSFQLKNNHLGVRPYSILTDENGNITGLWKKLYKKVIGFCCSADAGQIDVSFEEFVKTKQTLRDMHAVVEDEEGNFYTLVEEELEGVYIEESEQCQN